MAATNTPKYPKTPPGKTIVLRATVRHPVTGQPTTQATVTAIQEVRCGLYDPECHYLVRLTNGTQAWLPESDLH